MVSGFASFDEMSLPLLPTPQVPRPAVFAASLNVIAIVVTAAYPDTSPPVPARELEQQLMVRQRRGTPMPRPDHTRVMVVANQKEIGEAEEGSESFGSKVQDTIHYSGEEHRFTRGANRAGGVDQEPV